MSKETSVEHQKIEVEGFIIVDSTAAGLRPHDDLVWVGYGGMEGQWLSPAQAIALSKAIAAVANGNLVRRGLAVQN